MEAVFILIRRHTFVLHNS